MGFMSLTKCAVFRAAIVGSTIAAGAALWSAGPSLAETPQTGMSGMAGQQSPRVQISPAHRHGPESVADLAEALLDAVVNVSTTQIVADKRSITPPQLPEGSPFQEFFDEFFNRRGERGENGGNGEQGQGRPRRVQSLGSGFVIDGENGIIITNNHVIDEADEILINFNNGDKLKAEIIGRDSKTDLAVLKVNPKKPLTAVKFGESAKIRVGDWVMAIGNPFNLGGTVTVGIVSARNRDIRSGPYDDFIQTDAAINRGNSGGPLFNMYGEVIGINTAIISPSGGSIGIGFAIPSAIATRVINQLRQYGETRRGWLGVRIQQVNDDIAEGLGLEAPTGALVAGVTPDGPAAKGGIEPGDLILEFDGRKVPEMRELPRMVAETDINKEVDVLVLRKGERVTVKITLGRLEDFEKANGEGEGEAESQEETPVPDAAVSSEALGMTLAELTDANRAKFKINADVAGVLVTEVDPESAAAEKRVQAGDVIVEVAQEPVKTPADVAQRVAALEEEGRRSVLFLLSNANGELRFVAIRIDQSLESSEGDDGDKDKTQEQ